MPTPRLGGQLNRWLRCFAVEFAPEALNPQLRLAEDDEIKFAPVRKFHRCKAAPFLSTWLLLREGPLERMIDFTASLKAGGQVDLPLESRSQPAKAEVIIMIAPSKPAAQLHHRLQLHLHQAAQFRGHLSPLPGARQWRGCSRAEITCENRWRHNCAPGNWRFDFSLSL